MKPHSAHFADVWFSSLELEACMSRYLWTDLACMALWSCAMLCCLCQCHILTHCTVTQSLLLGSTRCSIIPVIPELCFHWTVRNSSSNVEHVSALFTGVREEIRVLGKGHSRFAPPPSPSIGAHALKYSYACALVRKWPWALFKCVTVIKIDLFFL